MPEHKDPIRISMVEFDGYDGKAVVSFELYGGGFNREEDDDGFNSNHETLIEKVEQATDYTLDQVVQVAAKRLHRRLLKVTELLDQKYGL